MKNENNNKKLEICREIPEATHVCENISLINEK